MLSSGSKRTHTHVEVFPPFREGRRSEGQQLGGRSYKWENRHLLPMREPRKRTLSALLSVRPFAEWPWLKRVCLIAKQFSLEYKWSLLSLSNAIHRNGFKRPKFRVYYNPSCRPLEYLYNLRFLLENAIWMAIKSKPYCLVTENIGPLFLDCMSQMKL